MYTHNMHLIQNTRLIAVEELHIQEINGSRVFHNVNKNHFFSEGNKFFKFFWEGLNKLSDSMSIFQDLTQFLYANLLKMLKGKSAFEKGS